MNKHLQNALILIGFLLIGGTIYSNTLSAQFVLDSKARIVDNRYLRISSLTVDSLTGAVFNKQASKNRPIPNLSFALNYYFDQYNVKYYHVVNILLHLLTGILLFFLFKTLLNVSRPDSGTGHPPAAALAATLIWLVHPVHTQSVTYIVQRSNIMAALFCIIALLLYIKGRASAGSTKRKIFLVFAALSWLLALGCKQNAAILPFLILLYEWYFFQDLSKEWLKKNLKYFIGTVLLFSVIAFIYLGPDPVGKLSSIRDFSEAKFTLTERILTQFRVIVYYLSLFFYPNPSRLNLDYDFSLSTSLFDPITTLFSALLLIGLIITGILTAKKHRLISFCIFWYFINLAIESSIIPLAIIFEHRTYMPFMGLALLTVLLVDQYLKLLLPKVILLCLLVSVSTLWTWQRNETWKDPVTLWQDVVSKSPAKARPHNNLGLALFEDDKTDTAIIHYKTALEIEPNHKDALNNFGAALKAQNRIAEAVQVFKAAIEVNPYSAEALNNLGSALLDQGKTEQAVQYFKAALKIDAAYPEALNNLGAAYRNQDNPDDAFKSFEAALNINPQDVSALNHLGLMHVSKGDISKALELFKRAYGINPDNAETHVNLGAIYLKLGQIETAILHLETALKLNPEMAQAHTNLGVSLMQRGDFQKGFYHIEKAVELEPENEKAQLNFNRALAIREQIESNISELINAADTDPQNQSIYSDLATLYQSIGNDAAAIKALNKALEIEPDSDTLLNSLGNLYLADKQYGQALKVFEKHLSLDPEFSLPYYNMARLHARQNRIAEAVNWLEQAISRGYSNWERIKSDADLDGIRDTSEYAKLLKGR